MRWFKQSSSERNLVSSKLVRRKFGAEGYGIFTALKEVIAENVEADNFKEWGSVNRLHDMDTLAEECCTTVEKLHEILKFCDEKEIFEKRNGKLYWSDMLNKLDDYAERLGRQIKKKKSPKKIGTLSEQTTDIVGTKSDIEPEPEQEPDNNITNVIVTPKISPKEYGNPEINQLGKYFLEVFKLPKEDCTQQQSRQYWNLLLKESKTGVDGVKWLVDLAVGDDFYKNNITSSKDLYYKRVKLMARKRGDVPLIAKMS